MFLTVSFVYKQLVAVLDTLDSRDTQVILFPFWNGIQEIPSDMRPAATAFDIFQVVVALIPVCFNITSRIS